MSRIAQVFENNPDSAKFIAYVCALDPDFNTSLKVCKTLVEAGVDVIELGVPFSDPLADGKTNQLAAERALANGATPDQVLDLVREIRKFSEVPIVFYTYYNLIHNKGTKNYAKAAKDAGADGILALDLPPEEADEMVVACKEVGLDRIFLIAPTTPESRIPVITKDASGFIYYVSQEGVTGERKEVAANLENKVARIRAHTDLPVAVGFGISNANHVRQVSQHADGVIVGSSIVNIIAANAKDSDTMSSELMKKITDMRTGLSDHQ